MVPTRLLINENRKYKYKVNDISETSSVGFTNITHASGGDPWIYIPLEF